MNTNQPQKIRVFNQYISREEWDNVSIPNYFYFDLCIWISKEKMTDDEKKDNPNYETIQGYLKRVSYKEAWLQSWNKATSADRKLTFKIPGFKPDLFEEISGIDVTTTKEWEEYQDELSD